jgi:hypothetical protein
MPKSDEQPILLKYRPARRDVKEMAREVVKEVVTTA